MKKKIGKISRPKVKPLPKIKIKAVVRAGGCFGG
jgi:hypothetical protein